jgi:hypothetical protein
MKVDANRKAFRVAAGFLTVFLLLVFAGVALASHTIVTVSTRSVTAQTITGKVAVRNTIASAQTGTLKLVVFEVEQPDPKKADAQPKVRLNEMIMDLGTVTLPAGSGSTVDVPFTIDVEKLNLKGTVTILADFMSAVGGTTVPHTHAGTLTVIVPEEDKSGPNRD